MPVVKNTNVQNASPKKRSKGNLPTINDEIWFPEQLAKVNALLDNAILLPPHNQKVKKHK